MNFDRKMKVFIFLAIGITTMIILAASSISYMTLATGTTQSLISGQVHAIAGSLGNALQSYKNTSIALMLDDSVQQYLKNGFADSTLYYQGKIKARQSMVGAMNIHSNMNFVVVIKEDLTDFIYAGNMTLTSTQFLDRYDEDVAGSRLAGRGTMRINFQSAYYNGDPYAVSVYQPIYDTSHIGAEIGLLCFSVKEPMLEQILDMQNATLQFRLSLVDGSGCTVSSSDPESIGQTEPFTTGLTGRSGTLTRDGQVYIYEKLGYWDYYVVGAVSTSELYRDGLQTVVVLVAAIILMVIVSLVIGTRIVKHSYHAMEEIVTSMEAVSDGHMDVVMNENTPGDDFTKIARGFNHMTARLGELMEQVKEEQHQIEQIKLNALQSQIQPHFLYNTLECIHWQAAMDGNKEISRIVKALATYYRLCLSKGRDVIDLSQEIRHIESYVTIQNVRYGNIIAYEMSVPPEFDSVQIPKMTLQPLIENSIYHGIRIKDGKSGRVTVTARRENGDIIVTVADDGAGLTQERIDEINDYISVYDENFGYGVRNVHKRIELTFGREYGLYYRASESGGLTVDIRLPGTKPYDPEGSEADV